MDVCEFASSSRYASRSRSGSTFRLPTAPTATTTTKEKISFVDDITSEQFDNRFLRAPSNKCDSTGLFSHFDFNFFWITYIVLTTTTTTELEILSICVFVLESNRYVCWNDPVRQELKLSSTVTVWRLTKGFNIFWESFITEIRAVTHGDRRRRRKKKKSGWL